MSAVHHLKKVRELVARTRAEQGLPPTVVDELTLGKCAELFKLAPDSGEAA